MRRRIGAVAGALVAVVALGACGGGDGGSGVASLGDGASAASARKDDEPKRSFEDAMLDYARCMRRNGVDMPDPKFTGDGRGLAIIGKAPDASGAVPPRATLEAAEAECGPILEAARQDMPKLSAEDQAKMRDHALAIARCMRARGFDMPDPTFDEDGSVSVRISGGGATSGEPGADGPAPAAGPDPAFTSAMDDCQEEAGGPPLGATRREAP